MKPMNPILALLAIAFLAGAPAKAQMVNAPISTERVPDVQVVAFPLPTHEWAVTTVYPGVVNRSLAEGRVRRLMTLGGWEARGMEFKNSALERASANAPKSPIMTSVTFRTYGSIVDLAKGTMPLEPFARAFRDLGRVHVTYIVPGKTFTFRGIRQFSDNNLDVSLSQGQGAYTYMMNIKNHNLESLRLPQFETLKSDQTTQSADATGTRGAMPSAWVGTGLAVLLALGAGAVAYLLFTRMTAR